VAPVIVWLVVCALVWCGHSCPQLPAPFANQTGAMKRQPSLSRTCSADIPATRMTLLRLLKPDAMVTELCGTFKSFAKNSMQAWLARPSVGGAVRETFNASPISPVIAFFLARG
jgi:hypothetical protein